MSEQLPASPEDSRFSDMGLDVSAERQRVPVEYQKQLINEYVKGIELKAKDELSEEESQTVSQSEQALGKILEFLAPTINHAASKYMNRGVEREDLVGEAVLGVADSLLRFDKRNSEQMAPYFNQAINTAMENAVAKQGFAIEYPAAWAEFKSKLDDKQSRIGRPLADSEIIEIMGPRAWDYEPPSYLPNRRVEELKQPQPLDVDDPTPEQDDNRLATAPDSELRATHPERAVELYALKQQIGSILNELDPKERELIELRYGLDGKGPRTLIEVGKQLNVTREEVRRIEKNILARLRSPKNMKNLEEFSDL